MDKEEWCPKESYWVGWTILILSREVAECVHCYQVCPQISKPKDGPDDLVADAQVETTSKEKEHMYYEAEDNNKLELDTHSCYLDQRRTCWLQYNI